MCEKYKNHVAFDFETSGLYISDVVGMKLTPFENVELYHFDVDPKVQEEVRKLNVGSAD